MTPLIRPAMPADLLAINDLYNHYVPNSTCTFQTETETAEGRRTWFESHDAGHPILVAEQAAAVVAWASLSPFAARQAYRHTVEDSVYVRHDLHGRGIGGLLLATLVERARELGHHSVIAKIAAEQSPSIALHVRCGFIEVARLREAGRKFGRWIDVVYLQKML